MIEKPWGWENIIENNGKYVVKKLFMRKGHQCSLQYHRNKIETIIVLEGSLMVDLGDREIKLDPYNDSQTIIPNQQHRMRAIDQDCLYLECSTCELDDVVRLEDSYGRV